MYIKKTILRKMLLKKIVEVISWPKLTSEQIPYPYNILQNIYSMTIHLDLMCFPESGYEVTFMTQLCKVYNIDQADSLQEISWDLVA